MNSSVSIVEKTIMVCGDRNSNLNFLSILLLPLKMNLCSRSIFQDHSIGEWPDSDILNNRII